MEEIITLYELTFNTTLPVYVAEQFTEEEITKAILTNTPLELENKEFDSDNDFENWGDE